MKKLNCSSCGAELRIEENKEYAVCDHCGTKYKLNEDLNINIKLDDNVKDVINTSFGTVNKASKFMFLPIFIFIIAFSLILFIGIRTINRSRNNNEENRKQTEEKVNNQQEEVKKDIFNFQFVNDNGTKSAFLLESTLDEIIQSNKLYTRKVTLVVEELCGKSISKSSVSELCKDLNASVKAFKERPLTDTYPFLIVDATYFKVRENHRVISKALMIALAFTEKGKREVVGFELYDCENKENWYDFFMHLQSRGLKGLKMITSDAHEGILHGIRRVYPEVPWQRCQFHFIKNIVEKAPKSYQAGLRIELNAMFQCKDIKEVRKKRKSIMQDYAEVAPKAMECLDLGFDSAITVYCLPETVRRYIRTSNHIERLNRELKRRSTAIGVFPNGESVVRLMGTLLMEHHEKIQGRKPLFYSPAYQEILEKSDLLKQVAREQRDILAA